MYQVIRAHTHIKCTFVHTVHNREGEAARKGGPERESIKQGDTNALREGSTHVKAVARVASASASARRTVARSVED